MGGLQLHQTTFFPQNRLQQYSTSAARRPAKKTGLSPHKNSTTAGFLKLSSPSRNSKPCVKCKASLAPSQAGSVVQQLNAESLERWQASHQKLIDLGLSIEEADKTLGKASGYVKSPYWGANKEQSVPPSETVISILDYLKSLGLTEADLSTVLKKFPEILGCKLEAELKNNVGILDSSWGISGTTLKNLILRKPEVLGYNVDCKGDCMAECTRCWARF